MKHSNAHRLLLHLTILSLTLSYAFITPSVHAQAPRKLRLETKLLRDSTRFKMTIEPGAKPTAGKTFKARIHVTPGKGWHVWSSSMSSAGGLVPLTIRIPDSISKYFAITTIKEIGKPLVLFDSNFMVDTRGYHEPFDIVMTVKVKENAPAPVPFSVWLNFQTCDETMCLPPRTFVIPMNVLGEKPLELTIAKGKADTTVDPKWPKLESAERS